MVSVFMWIALCWLRHDGGVVRGRERLVSGDAASDAFSHRLRQNSDTNRRTLGEVDFAKVPIVANGSALACNHAEVIEASAICRDPAQKREPNEGPALVYGREKTGGIQRLLPRLKYQKAVLGPPPRSVVRGTRD